MNRIEIFVYNIVRKNPAVKQFIRDIYQIIFDCFPKRKNYFQNPVEGRKGFFFGFHDISPFSIDERKLLSNKICIDLRMPAPNDPLDVGYFDFNNNKIGEFHRIGSSFAWNYHKGCRLQWLDNDVIIYNSADNGKLCSIVTNLINSQSKIIPYAIDSVYGTKATSISYERLERCMPGYGYPYKDEGYITKSAPKETGLFLVDLSNGERTLLLSIYDIAMTITGKVEEEYLHFITHTEFSKNGRYISFLYRRIPNGKLSEKRRTLICIYDTSKKRLLYLPTDDSGSHYVWNERNQIIASCFLNNRSCHVLYDIDHLSKFKIIDPSHLNSDGHQSFIDNDTFVTDTYPDKWRMSKTYKVDIKKNISTLIASIYSPKKYQTKKLTQHIACDLHPRVSQSGKYLCFDSVHENERGIYVTIL